MSVFGKVKKEEAQAEDLRVGGGFTIFPSGAYTGNVKKAFITESAGGALAVNLEIDITAPEEYAGTSYRETMYFTNKNKETAYTDKKTGARKQLPSFTLLNELSLIALEGREFLDLENDAGVVSEEVYNSTTKQRETTQVPSLTPLLGKEVSFLIQEVKEFAQVKNEATGFWEENTQGYTRRSNNIQRFYNGINLCTATEMLQEKTDGVQVPKWLDNNDGKVYDKTRGAEDKPVPSGGIPAEEPKSTAAKSGFFAKK